MPNNRRKAAGGRDRIRKSRLKAYLLTAVFTLFIAVILIQQLGMYPFGDYHLCYSDADQYYGFYGYLMSTFFSGNDLFYSWSMALGNRMLSTYAYYAASPLNLLLVFFRKDLILGMQVIVFIRTFLISLSFCTLLNDCGPGREVEKAILSASYAFIGYTAFYAWNASWMDGVALLPLMVLGLKKLLDRRQKLFYTLILALAVFSNLYIGYMLCAASLVFYLIYCLDFRGGPASALCRLKGTFLRYAGSSVLGVCLFMALLLPAYLGIPKERKTELTTLESMISPQFKLSEFFSMFFSGTALVEDSADNFPVIFVGILPLVLVLIYFLNRKIRIGEKIRTAVMLLMLVISFEIPFINTAWHGFSVNHWFNFRYSFVFSFIMLLTAYRSLTKLPEKTQNDICGGGSFSADRSSGICCFQDRQDPLCCRPPGNRPDVRDRGNSPALVLLLREGRAPRIPADASVPADHCECFLQRCHCDGQRNGGKERPASPCGTGKNRDGQTVLQRRHDYQNRKMQSFGAV